MSSDEQTDSPKSAENGRLTPKQTKGVAAIVSTRTYGEAAEAAGVAERTIRRWMKAPAFRRALADAEGDVLDTVTRRLVYLQRAAVDEIAAQMTDADAPPTVRLRAAQTVIDTAIRLVELRTLERRIAALESEMGIGDDI